MSGLEPIVALGVACNILQIIGVGRETVRIARQVYQEGVFDPALADKAAVLGDLSKRIRDATITTRVGIPSTPPDRDSLLLELAEKCLNNAQSLREEVKFLSQHPSRAKLVETLKIVVKTKWRKKRLRDLESKLRAAEGQLRTGLLTRIYEASEKNGIGIAALDANLRSFIEEYRKGKSDALALVSAQALRTREHVTTETKGGVNAIKTHIIHETTSQAEGSLGTHILFRKTGGLAIQWAGWKQWAKELLLKPKNDSCYGAACPPCTCSLVSRVRWVYETPITIRKAVLIVLAF
ncbi:hypothetical protein RB595_003814 [Gaeumannomyces hyphopodioides]